VTPIRSIAALLLAGAAVVPLATTGGASATSSAGPRVLLVGTYHGQRGQFASIQAAVDAARPGDWILVAPGDYHEQGDRVHPPSADRDATAGVLITTPDVHLRGLDRNGVFVDGTRPGAARCSRDQRTQDLGVPDEQGAPSGRNGIVVWKADDVTVENLTVCNFLSGASGAGNEIWWNGGDGSGLIGMHGYTGRYLTATSSYFGSPSVAASYGIFSSNARGRALWDDVYASNFSDSGMYVGACRQECDMTIAHAWMEYSALGYSGTNSGGAIVIEHSRFDNNRDGFDTNTQIAGDPPAPQDGACPNGAISPITHTHSCWVFVHNRVDHNNNPNAPAQGTASLGPVGTGMTVSGGRNDTVMDNNFEWNGAWGALFVPYPDTGTPDPGQTCDSVGGVQLPGFGCVLDPEGDALLHNTFRHNGFFANPTNSDYGELSFIAGKPRNCYAGNVAPDGSVPAELETTQPTCGPLRTNGVLDPDLLTQVLCDTGLGECPPGSSYPQPTGVVMHPLPPLPTMPDPCAGVPTNPWCHH
jgi:hypothetical protein